MGYDGSDDKAWDDDYCEGGGDSLDGLLQVSNPAHGIWNITSGDVCFGQGGNNSDIEWDKSYCYGAAGSNPPDGELTATGNINSGIWFENNGKCMAPTSVSSGYTEWDSTYCNSLTGSLTLTKIKPPICPKLDSSLTYKMKNPSSGECLGDGSTYNWDSDFCKGSKTGSVTLKNVQTGQGDDSCGIWNIIANDGKNCFANRDPGGRWSTENCHGESSGSLGDLTIMSDPDNTKQKMPGAGPFWFKKFSTMSW